MREFDYTRYLKHFWLSMLEPPWRPKPRDELDGGGGWVEWLWGWAWALAGLALGAVYAPSLVQFAGLSASPYQDWLVIGIAALAGLFLQAGAALSLALVSNAVEGPLSDLMDKGPLGWFAGIGMAFALAILGPLLPIACVGYGIYLYLTSLGADQSSVTVAFVGGLFVKTLVIPFIKGLVTGALFKWFLDWLRGGKKGTQSATAKAASPSEKTPNPHGKGA